MTKAIGFATPSERRESRYLRFPLSGAADDDAQPGIDANVVWQSLPPALTLKKKMPFSVTGFLSNIQDETAFICVAGDLQKIAAAPDERRIG